MSLFHMDGINALTLIEALLIVATIIICKAIKFMSPSLHGFHPVSVDSSNNDVVQTSIASSSSSSSSSFDITVASPAKHDVFLSFRGEDTRDNFTSHLYKELCRAKIQTFIDNRLEKGEEISPILLRTIEESEIYVIIFSKDYASSTWCLDELVKILECKEKYGRIVIPIFYNIDPSNIRKQSESFRNSFIKHEQRFKNNMDKVQRWKDALTQVASLSGWDSITTRPESKLVRKIATDVLRKLDKLDHNPSYSFEGLVGIQHHILGMEELLSLESPEVRIVGIWGMGGIGKTTLARVLFQKLKENFESCSFVANAREQLTRTALDQLQNKCLLELLGDGNIGTYNIRSSYVKNKLQNKKILLVLDDVDNYIRAEDLIKLCDWFGQESRIIITSRDMQVLKNATAYRKYHVKKMDFNEAFELFSLKAFKQNEPPKLFLELSEQVVNYCQGIPLALTVLGCFLHGRRKEEWESALENLKQAPHTEIFDVLRISFDGLNDNQKNIFLDLACSFRERYLFSELDHIRNYYDFPIDIEISVLIDRSLISVEGGIIMMHDLVGAMAREIACQQFISEPRKSIRLWKHKDIYHVFKNNKGTETIHAIHLDICSIKRIHLKANVFRKMHNMRFLIFYKSSQGGLSNLLLSEGLDILPEELRFLCWEDYPLPYIPLHFCSESLVDLEMPNSHIQKLWDGDQLFPSLKRINLNFSKRLIELPDLSQTPNLKSIHLFGCKNLVQVCSSTILPKLQILRFVNCDNRKRIKLVAGNNDGITLGLVAVYNYFDLDNFSLFKMVIKVFTSDIGKISSFEFKTEWAPFTEILTSIDATESVELKLLASLLPFVNKLRWLDIPIELGNLGNHFEISRHLCFLFSRKLKLVKLRWEMTPTKIIKPGQSLMQPCMKGSTTKEVALSLEQWADLQNITEVESCSHNRLTRVPKSISRWSLLIDLSFQKSDFVRITSLSTLKSIAECDSSRFQPISDVTFSTNKGMDEPLFYMIGGLNRNASYYDSGFFSIDEGVISFSFIEDVSGECSWEWACSSSCYFA